MFKYRVLYPDDELFPPLLKEAKKCPQKLFVAGELREADYKGIAVVGARLMTSYGAAVVKSIVGELVNCGVTIISGLAFGVDIEAQKLALEMGGRTLGVCSGGLNQIVPRANFEIAERIVKSGQGALISIYEPNQQAERWSFPERDFLMAALSSCVLVIEAGEKSGTAHTVNAAVDLSREVFVVPGSIFSDLSVGCHKYIQEGAHLVTSAQDIFDEMGERLLPKKVKLEDISDGARARHLFDNELQSRIYEKLDSYGADVNELCLGLKEPMSKVLSAITIMEIKGLLNLAENKVMRSR